jgi:hypothetical protein
MLLRLTKIQRKTIGIYAPILLHDLGCRPGGGSQKQGIGASRAEESPVAEARAEAVVYILKLIESMLIMFLYYRFK